ncbi:hypothetical protein TWF694_000769 [Orbilia ellipsospora]|uniref:UVI-1 n=1 Tax=Orbilia ellipsospora TaxID=2528407 RepID=A0AAV9XRC7_9PEZI
MHFFKTALTTALGLLSVPAFSQLTPQEVVENINILTAKSQALQAPANSITIINGPLIVIGLGPFPPIIAGFSDIIQTVTNDIAAMAQDPQYAPGPDSDNIFNAFREFVRVHQQLLNILIGKAGLFQTVPLIGEPVAQVLRSLEAIVDTVAFGLIDTVQSRSADIQAQASSLDVTIGNAIKSYEGLLIKAKERRHAKDFQV